MPRHRPGERMASDAGALGLSMEARMARIEAMMEALLQERAMYPTPSGGVARGDSESDMAMSMPMADPNNTALAFLDQPPHIIHPQDAIDPLLDSNTTSLRIGSQNLAFPAPADYQNYIDTFFRELQVCHPCIDEHLFRDRSEKMLARAEVHPDDTCFLALNYVMFALHIASTEVIQPCSDDKLPGWLWLQLADDVIGKRQLYGQGDISLAQFLLLKAIYYTLVDQPSLAYNTIGLASRYVLQQNLNRQSALPKAGIWESFERLHVFWNILIADRRISLSCGRPYTIRDTDIAVERPSRIFQRDIAPTLQSSQQHDRLSDANSASMFLSCMIDWSRFAGSLWDGLFAARVATDTLVEKVATFDAAVNEYLDETFSVSKSEFQPAHRHPYIYMSFDNLRLMARRAMVTSLAFDHAAVHRCSTFAVDTLAHVQAYETYIGYPSTCMLRHHIIPSLANSLLLLCSMLVSNLGELGLSLTNWVPMIQQAFDTAVSLLHDLAREIPLAQRVLKDFAQILPVVQSVLTRWSAEAQLLQGPTGWERMKDLVPPNVTKLLPYREQVPNIHSPALGNEMWVNNGGNIDPGRSFSNWEEDLEPLSAGNSVLWI
ncbi:hypothetical protein OPT61_g7139 [Boeremia exigua]|uniref:Uncharacterized protein n=1 Tax=Boeremia exigua TaxID=749465 RepID=A0ACC2I543_9PLEO|nr:hypothetical protein OPT61_g7139 [Boeremia exigua]